MKIHSNIPKLQTGGAAPPFVSWSPIPSTPVDTSVTSTDSSKSSDDGLLSKEMVKLLMENGLPSDVEVFTQSINSLYNNPVYKVTGQLNTGALSNQYLRMLSNINKIKFYKDQYDNSVTRLTANGGLYDLAITSMGGMIVQDLETAKIKQVSPTEFYENYGNYKTITNGDLAHLRATNPSMGFDNSVFATLNNGIGQKEVQSYLDSVLKNLGSSTISSDGYISRKGNQILGGISLLAENPKVKQALIQAYTSEDGVYKISESETSNVKQAESALNYIFASLPENMKNYLMAKAAANGYEPIAGSKAVLADLVESKINNSSSFNIDYDSALSKAVGVGTNTTNLNDAHILLEGLAGRKNLIDININTGGMITLTTPGVSLPALHTLDQKDVHTNASMRDIVADSILATGDSNAMYFGDKKLKQEDLTRLMYNPQGGIAVAYIPVNTDGTPDLIALKNIQEAEDEIDATSSRGTALEKDIYSRHGVGHYYGLLDAEGSTKLKDMGRAKIFFMVDAQAVNGTGIDYDNDFVMEIEGKDKKALTDLFNKSVSDSLGLTNKERKSVTRTKSFLFFGSGDKMFNGTFFIAAPDNYTAQFFLGKMQVPGKLADTETLLQQDLQDNINQSVLTK